MPLFTSSPELTIGFPELPFPERPGGSPGSAFVGVQSSRQLFASGSDVFMVSMSMKDTFGSSASVPLVAKRGSPWTLSDSAGFQNLADNWFFVNQAQCQVGSNLYIIGSLAAPFDLIYVPFDFSSDLFGTDALPYTSGTQPAAFPMIQPFSDGSLVAVWGSPDSTMTGAKFSLVTSGGSFGSATVLVSTSVGQLIKIVGLVVDASDVAHVLYIKSASGVSDLWHNTITSGGSVGTADLVEASIPQSYDFGPGLIFAGKLTFTGSKSGDANVYLFETDPTTISWTKKTVSTRVNTSLEAFAFPVDVSGSLYILWADYDGSLYPASSAMIWYSIYDGSSFTTKDVAWDAGANQYPSTGISPDGDIDVEFASAQFSGGKLRLLGWSEFDSSFNETELYLEVTISGQSGYRNRFY